MASLGIALITYNRASALADSLRALAGSPVAGLPLTVIDNCSTDGTAEVCQTWAHHFPHFSYERNPINIGLGPNYLRALERIKADYLWILCDDDQYDFSDWPFVEDILNRQAAELVFVGHHPSVFSSVRGECLALREVLRREKSVLLPLTFIPSLIVKRGLLSGSLVAEGYRAERVYYPHAPWLLHALESDRRIAFVKKDIVLAGASMQNYTDFEVNVLRARTLGCSKDRQLARHVWRELRGNFPALGLAYLVSALRSKVLAGQMSLRRYLELSLYVPCATRLFLLLALPLVALPNAPLRLLYSAYCALRRKSPADRERQRARVRGDEDVFRG